MLFSLFQVSLLSLTFNHVFSHRTLGKPHLNEDIFAPNPMVPDSDWWPSLEKVEEERVEPVVEE